MCTSQSNAQILIRRLAAELYIPLSAYANTQSNLFTSTKPPKDVCELIELVSQMAAERSFRFCIFVIFCCGLTEYGACPSKTRYRRT